MKEVDVKCRFKGQGGIGRVEVLLPEEVEGEKVYDKVREAGIYYDKEKRLIYRDITYANKENVEERTNDFLSAVLGAIEFLYSVIEYSLDVKMMITKNIITMKGDNSNDK